MHRGRPRLFVAFCATILLGSCDKDPFAPGAEPSLAAISGASFNLTATAVSHTQIDLVWKDVSGNESGYEVYRSATGPGGPFGIVAIPGPNATSHSDGGLVAATEYCYQVRLFRRTGRKTSYSAFSSTACARTQNAPTPPPGPTAPSALNARPLAHWSNAAVVTWNDNSSDEEGFRVERALSDQGPWDQVAVRAANTTSQNDYNRPLEQQLCYRVIAFKGQAESASNVDCTYLPAAPTALTITAVSGQAVDLAWTDNSAYEESFEIHRSIGYGAFGIVGTVGANVTTFHDVTVSADQTYHYMVRVVREGVPTGTTNSVKAITATGPPAAPLGLYAVPSGSAGVAVSWTDNSATEEEFVVERSENGGATWVEAGRTTGLEFVDGERASEQQVCYHVIASNTAFGAGPPSNVECTAPPAAPTNLVATTMPGLAIDLTWKDNSGVEDGYVVQRVYEYCDWYGYCSLYYEVIATLGPNAESHQDAGLTPGEHRVYVVNATKRSATNINAVGYSYESNQADAWSDFPPDAPSNVTAVAISSTRIDLAWSDNPDEDYFVVTRCTGSEAACGDGAFGEVAWLLANVTTFSDTGVQPSTTYTYRIHAYRGRYSDPSNEASATTPP